MKCGEEGSGGASGEWKRREGRALTPHPTLPQGEREPTGGRVGVETARSGRCAAITRMGQAL